MGEKNLKQRITELVNPLKSFFGSQGSGQGAQIQGDASVEKGDFIGRDQININISFGAWQGEKPQTATEALNIYRGVLAHRCGDIPLSGLDRGADDAGARYRPLGLERVYVDLDTGTSVSDEQVQQALSAGRSLRLHQSGTERADDLRPLSALEAVVLNPRLVLLGEPGSGKTTFVNRLCLALAGGRWEDLDSWPERDRNRLPVLVILRDFARWLREQSPREHAEPIEPCARLLWDYLRHDLDRRNLDFFADRLRGDLRAGRAQVFLDGLDEVPPAQREAVLTSVNDFAGVHHQSRILVTCRVASYEQPTWRLPDDYFPELRLAPFDRDRIEHFVDAWYEEMAARWNEPRERTGELAAKLKEALQRPDLARLAPNPLLLTVMALVHTRDRVLPDHRAELYERTVEILLWRWEGRKQDIGGESELIERLRKAQCSQTDLLRVLRRLAFAAHAESGAGDPDKVAGIGDAVLWKALKDLHPEEDLNWARDLVEHLRQRTGLLVEREPGVFAFPHRTFQEYLAAVHLARGKNFVSQVLQLMDEGAFWREVILLAVGHEVYLESEYDLPLSLVEKLCPEPKPADAVGWRRVRLAGDVIAEMGVWRARRENADLVERLRDRLAALVEQGKLEAVERAEAGEVLGSMGDPRFDPERLFLPRLYRGQAEPLLGFVKIPAGSFVMGEGEKERELEIAYEYWLARYPVTVAQFRAFVEDGGYGDERWWRREDVKVWFRKSNQAAPWGWETQRLHPNRPVMNVTWFEAVAYCAWLNTKLHELDGDLVPKDYRVRLPTEEEWEKAARAGGRIAYPWGGEEWDEQRANVGWGIGHPTPVGIYPAGATASGLHDLAGNVWEWTMSAEEGGEARVVRGGAWFRQAEDARCASRDWSPPGAGTAAWVFGWLCPWFWILNADF